MKKRKLGRPLKYITQKTVSVKLSLSPEAWWKIQKVKPGKRSEVVSESIEEFFFFNSPFIPVKRKVSG